MVLPLLQQVPDDSGEYTMQMRIGICICFASLVCVVLAGSRHNTKSAASSTERSTGDATVKESSAASSTKVPVSNTSTKVFAVTQTSPFRNGESTFVEVVGMTPNVGVVCYVNHANKRRMECRALSLQSDDTLQSHGGDSADEYVTVTKFPAEWTTVTTMRTRKEGGSYEHDTALACYVSRGTDTTSQKLNRKSAFCRALKVQADGTLLLGPAAAVETSERIQYTEV